MNTIWSICVGSLIALVLVTYVTGKRDPDKFRLVMTPAFVLWIASGWLMFITPLSFAEWAGGGFVFFIGGGAVLFNVIYFFLGPVSNWVDSTRFETVDGEVVDEPSRAPRLPATTSREITK